MRRARGERAPPPAGARRAVPPPGPAAMAEELVKYAVIVESVLGYLFLALFVVVLAR